MIESMLKYAFVLHHNDLDGFLNQLQELGVVDIERSSAQLDEEASATMKQISRYNTAYTQLKQVKIEKNETIQPASYDDAEAMISRYESLLSEKEQLSNKEKKLEKDIQDAKPWGIFDNNTVEKIQKLGLKPHFYTCPEKSFDSGWLDKYAIQEINRVGGWIYFVLLQHKGEDLTLDLQEIKFPVKSYEKLEAELSKTKESLKDAETELKQLSLSTDVLLAEKNKLTNSFEFRIAGLNARREAEESVVIISGWIPEENNDELIKLLENEGILYLSEKPTEEDNPPIKLKNSKMNKLFEVITKLYSLPKYTELDLTPFFAPFFMLFFGLCLGDGGYGILIILIATLLKYKLPKDYSSMLTLGQLFGVATIIVSLITTGVFFGVTFEQFNLVGRLEKKYDLPANNGMLYLALIIGFLQVLFGMCINIINIIRQKGWKFAMSKIGWVVLMVSAIIYFILGSGLGTISIYILYGLMGISALFIFFYNNPGKNVFMNFGGGIWDSYNMVSGLLGDLLSYIRLFALGLTGGILGNVFNQLAFSLKSDNIIVSILSVGFVLIIGHSLNIMLNTLGAFVHPLRLTFVEFYKNSGFEGGGKEYNPFKIN